MVGSPDTQKGGLCLIVDTASTRSAAAVYDMQAMRVVSSADAIIGRGHAEILTGQIEDALSGAGVAYAALARIAVTNGPGSFTGIRVGVAAARGLGLALGVPAIGVGVLEALAFPWLHQGGPVLAVQDARRDEVFAAFYDACGTVRAGPAAFSADSLAAIVEQSPSDMLDIAGSGGGIVAARLRCRSVTLHDPEGLPALACIGAIAATRQPGEAVSPLYLRGADAKPQSRPAGIVRTGLPSA